MLDENGELVKIPGTEHPSKVFQLPVGALVHVHDGDKASVGDVFSQNSDRKPKTRDITGGLPRVAELFEARSPKDAGVLAESQRYRYFLFGKNQGQTAPHHYRY